jgi:cytoskeletal protein RodZ
LKRWERTLSNNHSEYVSNKHSQLEEKLLPPRHTKHGKRNDEEIDQETERKKGFPVIQIVLYAFLALIAALLLFLFWQESQTAPSSTASTNKPAEEVSKQGEGSSSELGQETKEDTSKKTDPNSSDKDDGNEEPEPIGAVEEKEDNQNGNGLQSDKGQDAEESEQSEEPNSGPKKMAEHIVQPGETFYAITMKYYHSKKYMDYLAQYNGIKNIRDVQAGTTLIIPEKP